MTKRLSFPNLLFAIPIAIFAFSYFFAIGLQQASPALTKALTIDFIITAPISYFLIIRKKKIPNFTAISLSLIALFLASYIFPSHHQGLISSIKSVLIPILEILVIVLVTRKLYQIFYAIKKEKRRNLDFYDLLSKATAATLPKQIATLVTTEFCVFYYLFHPKGAKKLLHGQYSYHQKGGTILILTTFVGIILVETFAIHFLLASWNHAVAWVLSGLSIYTCLQIVALSRSFGKRPIEVDYKEKILRLRYGFFSHVLINIDQIERIQITARTLPKEEEMKKLSPFGAIDTHNLLIHLEEACEIERIYGKNTRTKKLAFFVDQKEVFFEEIMKIKKKK